MKFSLLRIPIALGALCGGSLLIMLMMHTTGDDPWDAFRQYDPGSNAFESVESGRIIATTVTCGFVGALLGSVIGAALRIALTQRPVNSLLRIAASWFVGAVSGLCGAIGVLSLPFMAPYMNMGRDGSGGPGVGLTILVFGLTGILCGSVAGSIVGIKNSSRFDQR